MNNFHIKMLQYKYDYRLKKRTFTPCIGNLKGETFEAWELQQRTKGLMSSIKDLSFEWFMYLTRTWETRALFIDKVQAYSNLEMVDEFEPKVIGNGKYKIIPHLEFPEPLSLFNIEIEDLEKLKQDVDIKYEVTHSYSNLDNNLFVYDHYGDAVAKQQELNSITDETIYPSKNSSKSEINKSN